MQAREYRAITAIDGYVHKFRLESCEQAHLDVGQRPTVQLRVLLGKLALSVLALGGLAFAGAHTIM